MAENLAVSILINAKDKASGVFSKLKSNVAGIAAGIAGYFSVNFFAGAVNDAQALETQVLTLNAVIKATGQAAGLTADEIIEMSKRLDEQTLGSEKGFTDAATSLLTFKSIGKDSFETVLTLAQDLATTGFGSLESNAKQLGKALEDPVRGLSQLRESGVSFTESQQDMIKALVEGGEKAKAQGIILDALTNQVGGAGKAAGGGLAGAIDLIGKRFHDFKQQLGQGMIEPLKEAANSLADFLKRMNETGGIKKFGDAIGSVFSAFVDITVVVADHTKAIIGLSAAYAGLKVVGLISSLVSLSSGLAATTIATKAATAAAKANTIATLTATKATKGFLSANKKVAAFLRLGLWSVAAEEAIKVYVAYNQLTAQQKKLATAERELAENTQERLAVMREEATQLGLNITAYGNNTTAIVDAILKKRQEVDVSKKLVESQRDFVSETSQAVQAGKDQAAQQAELNAELNKSAQALIDLGEAQQELTDETGNTSEAIKKLSDDDLTALLEKIDLVGQSEIFAGGSWDDLKSGLLSEQFSRIGLDFEKITGQVTETGAQGAEAFNNIAQSAGLTEEQLSKVAEKLISVANTKADVDLLKQSFADVGLEIDNHPELITAIVKKITELGGSLDDIPGKWKQITESTNQATQASSAYADSLKIAAQQQDFFNSVLADEARQRAIITEARRAQTAAEKEAEAQRKTHTKASSFSEAGSEAFGNLSASDSARLQSLIDDQNDANARGNSGRVQLDIEKMVIAMGKQQQTTAEQTSVLKTINQSIQRSGDVTLKLDGREIAASVQRAGLTAR